MVENQAFIFMIFTIDGIVIGILFDFFRIIRKVIKTSNLLTYIEDILFWIISGIIIIYTMYKVCDGQIRLFMIIGITLGAIFYILTFSKYLINISVYIAKRMKTRIIFFISKIKKICLLCRKYIFRPVFILCINLRKNVINHKKIEKNKKKERIFYGNGE